MRLFVAVNLPAEERRAAFEAAAPLRSTDTPINWVAEQNLHITLRFLGDVAPDRAQPIGAALAAAVRSARPFDLALSGVGGFPDLERPRVVWFGVEQQPALELLANDVEGALKGFGFEPELRPFQPHLTIGRARKDAAAGPLRDLEARAGEVGYSGLITVESVDLMHSTPGASGPTYTTVSRAALQGGA